MAKEETVKVWDVIKKQVEDIKYGSLMITIHDGRIVQIETNNKTRF